MVKKVLMIIYFLVVLVFAIGSLLITWANDSQTIFFLEIFIDIVILLGIMLFLYKKRIKWWLIPFLLSVIGEVYLLTIDERVGIKEAIQWVIILLPALYLNLKVSGFIGKRKLPTLDRV